MIKRIKRGVRHRCLHLLRYASSLLRTYPCQVKGHKILLDVETEIEEFRAVSYETKEPETLEWIERYFRPDDVFYDIGANIGLYSLFAATHLQRRCQVFAFEPEALNYAKLNNNIFMNKLSEIIKPYCLAVAEKQTVDSFFLHPDIFSQTATQGLVAGSALHRFGAASDYSGKEFQASHVQGMVGFSLDSLWQNWGMAFPNHIKIDVDGLEDQIVSGASETLKDERLRSVLIEVSGDQDPIFLKLTQAGFKSVTDFADHSSQQMQGQPHENHINCIFVRA